MPDRRRRRVVRTGPRGSEHWTDEERAAHARQQRQEMPVAELTLPVRVVNVLEEEGNIILVKQLLAKSYESLMALPNFGDKTLREVRAALTAAGITPPAWSKPVPVRTPRPKKGKTQDLLEIW